MHRLWLNECSSKKIRNISVTLSSNLSFEICHFQIIAFSHQFFKRQSLHQMKRNTSVNVISLSLCLASSSARFSSNSRIRHAACARLKIRFVILFFDRLEESSYSELKRKKEKEKKNEEKWKNVPATSFHKFDFRSMFALWKRIISLITRKCYISNVTILHNRWWKEKSMLSKRASIIG